MPTPFSSQNWIYSLNRGSLNQGSLNWVSVLPFFRYGGWYSDLDMVILKPLTEFRNVLSCDEALEDNDDDEKLLKLDKDGLLEDFLGKKVSNAIFHFEKGHLFLNRSIELFPKLFNGKWGVSAN